MSQSEVIEIDVTHINKRDLIQKAYELSRPQGLGFLHYNPDPLTDDELDEIIIESDKINGEIHLDYVNGRSLKFHVYYREDEQGQGKRYYIVNSWYDHSDSQLAALLKHFGISLEKTIGHSISCNCEDCLKNK